MFSMAGNTEGLINVTCASASADKAGTHLGDPEHNGPLWENENNASAAPAPKRASLFRNPERTPEGGKTSWDAAAIEATRLCHLKAVQICSLNHDLQFGDYDTASISN